MLFLQRCRRSQKLDPGQNFGLTVHSVKTGTLHDGFSSWSRAYNVNPESPTRNMAKASEIPTDCDRSILGIIPQQIRGDLNTFANNCMYGTAFDKCSGCSETVRVAYLEDKQAFMLKVCNQPDYLEDLTGITQMNLDINYDDIESLGSDF